MYSARIMMLHGIDETVTVKNGSLRGRSSIIWRLREGIFAQTVRMPSYGGRGLAKRHLTYY